MANHDLRPPPARHRALGAGVLGLLLALATCGESGGGCSGGERGSGTTGPPPDRACLQVLRKAGVAFTSPDTTRGIRTPVVIQGPIDGVRLIPRGRREALMDCALARALLESGALLRGLGIRGLEYSAAYDYRPRRGAEKLSAHAHGLAIDVHALRSDSRRYDIVKDFEKGAGEWLRLRPGPGALAGCVGSCRTEAGKYLRTLACRLKLHSPFRVLVTPDDNADHRDHFHLEVFPDDVEPPPLTN
jgi:hypothetical protein